MADTKLFANELLQTIRHKSYIPGAPPPPKSQPASVSQASHGAPSATPSSFPAGPAAGPRKRGFQDRGDFDAPNGREQFQGGGRLFKQPRRGGGFGRRGYVDPDAPQPVQQLAQHGFPGAPGHNALPYVPTGPAATMPNFVPATDPAEAMRQLQQLSQQIGMQMAQMSGFSPQPGFMPHQPPPQKKRGRCRDYDTKGYCARGQNCKFEHSNGPDATTYSLPAPQMSGQIQLPAEGRFQFDVQHAPDGDGGVASQQGSFMLPSHNFFDCFQMFGVPGLTQQTEYDPNTGTMMAPFSMPQFSQQRPSSGNPNNRRDNRQGQHQRRTGPPRASFSAAGPVHDKTQTKVVVESIPEEHFNEEQVRAFFSQYGNIEEVTMMPYKRLAIVKYDNWGSANAAYRSPKVIFDNRFVKVFWYKDEKHADIANGGASGPKNGAGAANGSGSASANGQEDEPELDMEEFSRKQEEAQKTHEEKMRKKLELDEQRAELEKRQKELQAKHEAEKQRLLTKLASSRKNSTEPGVEGIGSEDKTGDGSKSSQNEALRATLAKLQEEAKAFGLDPHASPESDAVISTYTFGGYTSRGRGGFPRGRGGYAPRGSYRGRGGRGNIHAAYAAFSLDNRPRKVAMSGVDFSAPEKDEALRQHLFVSLDVFASCRRSKGVEN